MELKIEDLKVGDELVCIDRDGYLNSDEGHSQVREMVLSSPIVVKEINALALNITQEGFCIPVVSLKYFKKKEQSQYTFDDLIDVAVQAYKDGKLNISDMSDKITVSNYGDLGVVESIYKKDTSKYKCFVDFIKSLYKETFVIETEEDVRKIKDDCDRITLSNGELMPKKVFRQLVHDYTYHIAFKVLKGATVTQSK